MFDWNTPLVNQDGKRVSSWNPSSYDSSITNVIFDDGTSSCYFTRTGCSNASDFNSPLYRVRRKYIMSEAEYMQNNLKNISDEELGKIYRELDARLNQYGRELLKRGYTIETDEEDDDYEPIIDKFNNITRIYKTEVVTTTKDL